MPIGIWTSGRKRPGRTPLPPLYVTPNVCIRVVSEHVKYGQDGTPYNYCIIRPHPLVTGICPKRARVVMIDHMGRALTKNEHVHHGSMGTLIDNIDNLEILSAAEHNRRHKTGARHSNKSRLQTSRTLRRMFAAGEIIPKPAYGIKNGSAKLNPAKVRKIRHLYRPYIFGLHKLSKMFGVSIPTIKAAINRATWAQVK